MKKQTKLTLFSSKNLFKIYTKW